MVLSRIQTSSSVSIVNSWVTEIIKNVYIYNYFKFYFILSLRCTVCSNRYADWCGFHLLLSTYYFWLCIDKNKYGSIWWYEYVQIRLALPASTSCILTSQHLIVLLNCISSCLFLYFIIRRPPWSSGLYTLESATSAQGFGFDPLPVQCRLIFLYCLGSWCFRYPHTLRLFKNCM